MRQNEAIVYLLALRAHIRSYVYAALKCTEYLAFARAT